MATPSQGSNSYLAIQAETAFGETPVSPNMKKLPLNTHSIALSKAALESAEIRSDRQRKVFRHGAFEVGGDISAEFRGEDFDLLLESALFSSWSANVLKIGTTPKFFRLEDADTVKNLYSVYTGCAVNSFNLSLQANNLVQCSFGIVGKTAAVSGTAYDSTPTETSDHQPYDANNYTAYINEGGVATTLITGLEMTLENNIAPTFVIGSTSANHLTYGRATLSGTLTLLYNDNTVRNKFINETETDLEFQLTDNTTGGEYTFFIPRVKFNSDSVPLDNEQDRLLTVEFVGLLDDVDSTLKITRA